MNFIKTQKLLTQQAGQTDIPLESVLELMRTYLTELHHQTNTSVDRCRIGNMSQLVANLAAVSNDILFVYRTNEKDIQAAENRFTQALTKAQNACGDYYSRITQLDEQIRQEEASQKELEALQAQESSRSAALAQLQQQTAALQSQIDALSTADPETEAGRLKALLEAKTGELALLKEECVRIQQEHDEKQQQLTEENARLDALRSQVNADMAKLKEVCQSIKEQEDIRNGLAQETLKLEHQVRQLKEDNDNAYQAQLDLHEKIDQAQAALDAQLAKNNLVLSTLTEKQTDLDALQAKHTQDQAKAKALEEQYAALEAEQTALKERIVATHQEKSAQLQALTDSIGDLEGQLQRLQEDASRRRTEIAAAEDALKAEREEFDQLLEQQVSLSVDLEAQKTDNANFLSDHLEPIKNQLAEQVVQARKDRAQLDELKNSIKLLEDSRTTMAQENAILKLKLKSKQASLDSVQADYDRNKQAVEVLEEDLRIKGSESAALLEKEKELRELLDEKNVVRIIAELESCNQRLEEDIRRAEQTEQALAEKQQDLDALQKKLILVQKQLEDCRNKESQLKQSHKDAAQEMDRITCQENRRRCEQLHNQLQLMQAMRDQLIARIGTTCGEGFCLPEQLQEDLELAEQTILALRDVIREYTSLRQNALETCN